MMLAGSETVQMLYDPPLVDELTSAMETLPSQLVCILLHLPPPSAIAMLVQIGGLP